MMDVVCDYQPPSWARSLKYIPKYRVKLANTPTPIQRWNIPNTPKDYRISIKRDDMTDCILSGNKCRKLEFLLAEAVRSGSQNVIVCGSPMSNLCRAVAIACRKLGLKPHLILDNTDVQMDEEELRLEGNLLIGQLAGADISFVKGVDTILDLNLKMEHLAQEIKKTRNENSYQIPFGGANNVGLFGNLDAFEEMITQGLLDDFDDIVVAIGSAGTLASLGLANYLTGSKLKIHGVAVAKARFTNMVLEEANDKLKQLGLSVVSLRDIVDVIEEHHGDGYGKSTQEEKDFLLEVCRTTGVVLDPQYTVKAALAMTKELHQNPGRFKGKRILFLHTGGIFEVFDGKMHDTLSRGREKTEFE